MAKVLMYTTQVCPYCQMASRLLEQKGVEIDKIRVDLQPERRREMVERAGGATTVPQIFIGDRHIGGYRELAQLDVKGELDPLLGL
ncbi:glutaredoxin 3 [Acidiferrobacter sp.]|uniref:glutaredoxin 3 n=1 Tax=Acidiferrobacter sp. TaxID=1872107 RepID=UPI00260EC532|nr:glutaredoxin 3 [Acidiferrobacter sp.]